MSGELAVEPTRCVGCAQAGALRKHPKGKIRGISVNVDESHQNKKQCSKDCFFPSPAASERGALSMVPFPMVWSPVPAPGPAGPLELPVPGAGLSPGSRRWHTHPAHTHRHAPGRGTPRRSRRPRPEPP